MLGQIDASARAERIWLKILRKPSSIIFTVPRVVSKTGITPEADLAAQTVRVNSDNRATAVEGEAGTAPLRQAIVYGVVGHPDGDVADTDMDEGYEFDLDGDHYRIIDLTVVPGGIQATAIVNG